MKNTLSKTGQNFGNYKLVKYKVLKDINLIYRELQHIPSKSRIIHAQADDRENLFSLSFQTLPEDSSGIAHILEHIVLCGSEKFPVKDPFFYMTRRSLNTFMNAMTGADFTCYPAASCLPKDFFHLLEVYADAVFHPKLTLNSFLQEGHRFEFEKKAKREQLVFKGIVFNEMKGAMSAPTSRLWNKLYEALFPQLTYRHNSGGDPACIPSLTYEALKSFHHNFYHPSRGLFFFYGDIPIEKTLHFLESKVLKNVEALPPLPRLKKQKRFTQAKSLVASYPAQDLEATKTYLALGFLTCPISDQLNVLALQLLAIALMGNDGAPLKKAFLASGLCTQAFCSIDDEISEVPFTFVFKGVSANKQKAVETLVLDEIKKLSQTGLDAKSIQLALHQLEFSRLEISKDDGPYGLNLFFRSCLPAHHGIDPLDSLSLPSLFAQLRKKIKDTSFQKNLLKKFFIQNKHRVRLFLKPDTQLEAIEKKQEKLTLQKMQKILSKQDIQTIKTQAKNLQKEQDSVEDASCLPSLSLSDISSKPLSFSLKKIAPNLYFRPTFTNQIHYCQLLFKAPQLTTKQIPLFKLFSQLVTQVAWGKRNYIDHLNYLQSNLGGVYSSTSIYLKKADPKFPFLVFSLSAKALYRKSPLMLKFLKAPFKKVNWHDKTRLKSLIEQHYTGLNTSLTKRALSYASKLSSSTHSQAAYLSHLTSGLPYYETIKELYENFEEKYDDLATLFQSFSEEIFKENKYIALNSCDQEFHKKIARDELFLKKSHSPFSNPQIFQFDLGKKQREAKIIASSVAFTNLSLPSVSYLHPDSVALLLATELFENKVLHKKIREQGGAYGGGSSYNPNYGTLSFYGYRDPELYKTLQAFEESVHTIIAGDFSDADLLEAKFGVLQSWDSPLSPGSEGPFELGCLLAGKSLQLRKSRRQDLLNCTKKKIAQAVKKHVLKNWDKQALACFASKSFINEKTKELQKFKQPSLIVSDV